MLFSASRDINKAIARKAIYQKRVNGVAAAKNGSVWQRAASVNARLAYVFRVNICRILSITWRRNGGRRNIMVACDGVRNMWHREKQA